MPSFNPESINKLGEAQAQIWEQVAPAVSEAFGSEASFTNPLTVASKPEDIASEFSGAMLVLRFAFESEPEHTQLILVPPDLAKDLAALVQGSAVEEINEEVLEKTRPAFEGLANSLAKAAGDLRKQPSTPSGLSVDLQILELPANLQEAEELARVQVSLSVGEASGTITWIFDAETAKGFIPGVGEEAEGGVDAEQSEPDAEMGAATEEETQEREKTDIDILLDVPLEISVELGRVRLLIQDIVELGTGSVIEIEKAAGEPVDVLVNGKLVARGEVVVIEDNFGVRISEILTPQERISKLGDAA